jgi:hypothetical protein
MRYGIVCAGLLAGSVYAAEDGQNKVEFTGSAAMQSGQFVNYKYWVKGRELSHQWLQDNLVSLGLRTQFHPRLQGAIGIMGWLYYNTFPDSLTMDPSRNSKGAMVSFNFDRAEMIVNCSPDPQDSLCKIHIGLFPYKYDHEARNLGEYLFRTGCYPGYVASDGFDMAGAQLAGIRVSNDLFNCWHNELFLTSELYLYPLNDFSLTYLTDYTPFTNKVFNVGAAVQLYHCFSVDNGYTQPKYYPQKTDTNKAPNYYFAKDDPLHQDTLFYTFAGTKIMARFTFDPKPLLGNLDIFGAEDLKLYSEVIILGVKNYPPNNDPDYYWDVTPVPINEFGYDKLMQKMPIMVGMNFPTFKILDVFSIEAEYYGKKYVNRVSVVTQSNNMMRLPLPYDPQLNGGYPEGSIEIPGAAGTYSKSTYYAGAAQWKWSVYLKKTLFNNFSITAQAARDHSRVQTSLAQSIDQEEALVKDKQWYWMLKFGYCF